MGGFSNLAQEQELKKQQQASQPAGAPTQLRSAMLNRTPPVQQRGFNPFSQGSVPRPQAQPQLRPQGISPMRQAAGLGPTPVRQPFTAPAAPQKPAMLQRPPQQQQLPPRIAASPMRSFAGLMSDETQKDKHDDGKDELGEFLERSGGAKYVYKDPNMPGAAPGVQYGIESAQELEKSEIGRTLVKDGEDGVKRVDTNRLSLVNAAAAHHLNERLKRLEEKDTKKKGGR